MFPTSENQSIVSTPKIHAFIEGQQRDIPVEQLGDIGRLSSDATILRAVALFLNLAADSLDRFVVGRDEQSGNIVIRPPAVFG